MDILLYIFVFAFGAIIGSFLNVVIYRYNTGVSINGRSRCSSCAKTLKYYELIPIFSFIFQRGRCHSCLSRISWQYPLVEITTGLLFLLSYTPHPISYTLLLFHWLIIALLIVITVYDIRHKIIPNGFVYAFIVLSFLWIPVSGYLGTGLPDVWDLLAGPILAFPLAMLWLLSQGKWMGLGDAKLTLGIGWFLGLYAGLSALILAFWIGAIAGIALLFLKGKTFTMKSEIPFGPFLILGTLLVFFFEIDIFSLLIF